MIRRPSAKWRRYPWGSYERIRRSDEKDDVKAAIHTAFFSNTGARVYLWAAAIGDGLELEGWIESLRIAKEEVETAIKSLREVVGVREEKPGPETARSPEEIRGLLEEHFQRLEAETKPKGKPN